MRRRIRRIKRKQREHNDVQARRLSILEEEPTEFQAVVIGAGPSGAHAARRLRKRFPEGRILLLEKTDRVGGRLLSGYEVSNQKGNSPVYDELGGMRIFTDLMSNVVEMVHETECNLVHVPLDEAVENLFYYKGVRHVKRDFKINGKEVPNILSAAISRFVEETDHTGDFHNSELVSSLSAREFMARFGTEEEEIDALLAYGGYDAIDEDFHAAVVLDDESFYTGGALSQQHHFVAEGYSTLIKRMVSRSNVELKLEAEVTGIRKVAGGKMVVEFEYQGLSRQAEAPMVFLCVAGPAIQKLLPSFVSPQRRGVLDRLFCISLFKCFLHWDDPEPGLLSGVGSSSTGQWWHKLGFSRGKHTTDLPVRMVWNYDVNDILIYNSGWTADGWHDLIKEDGIRKVAETMVGMLSEMFGVDVPAPNYEKTLWKYWPDGVAAWSPGTDVPKSIDLLCDGKSDGSELYVCGDANSRLQGWVKGAFDSVDCAFTAANLDS